MLGTGTHLLGWQVEKGIFCRLNYAQLSVTISETINCVCAYDNDYREYAAQPRDENLRFR